MIKMVKTIVKSPVLDVRETCRYLKVSRGKLYIYIKQGNLPYIKISGKIRFYEKDLLGFLDQHRIVNDSAPSVSLQQ